MSSLRRCSRGGRRRLPLDPPPSLDLSHAPPLPPQDPSAAIRCKMCVEAEAEAERKVAAERQATSKCEASDEPAQFLCSSCSRSLPASAFNRTQLSKGVEKQRCQECVSSAEKEANAAALKSRQQKLEEAQRHARTMEATGSAAQRCMAAASVAALEAQAVTGLKPTILGGKGRGRGRGRGRASGR